LPRNSLQPLLIARLLTILLVGSVIVCPAADGTTTPDPEGYGKATATILCDCGCHPQSVHDCACGRAAEMRNDMLAMSRQGMSGDEIIASYVERFGEQIRVSPTGTGFNLVAWLGPPLGLLMAALMLFFTLSRWSRRREATVDAAPAPASPDGVADVYHDRLRDALEKME